MYPVRRVQVAGSGRALGGVESDLRANAGQDGMALGIAIPASISDHFGIKAGSAFGTTTAAGGLQSAWCMREIGPALASSSSNGEPPASFRVANIAAR